MRFRCLTFILLTLLLLFVSCTKDTPDFKEVDVKEPPVQSEEIIEEKSDVSNEELDKIKAFQEYMWSVNQKYNNITEEMNYEEKITDFLDALSSGNIELVDHYLYGWGHDDFKNIKMTYEIISIGEPAKYDQCEASVLLNITESNSPAFPEGEHVYKIISRYLPDPCYITITKADRDISDNIPEERDAKLQDAILFGDRYLDFCFRVTKKSPDYTAIKELMAFDLYEKFIVKNGGFTLEEFRAHMKARFGGNDESFPEIEEMFSKAYNEESGRYEYSYGQCGDLQARRISKVEKSEKGYNITYECFSDMSYLQKCMEMTLVFEENKNSDIMRLERIERNVIIDVPMKTYSP